MSYRWAVSRFDMKLFPDCANPPHYVDNIRSIGYRELYTYRSADIDINNPLYLAGEALYRRKLEEGYTFRFYMVRKRMPLRTIYLISPVKHSAAVIFTAIFPVSISISCISAGQRDLTLLCTSHFTRADPLAM